MLLGDLRIQHTTMASVRLSYGEDLQMDWDGRGRLLVKVGTLPSLPPCSPALQSAPCAPGRVALRVGEEFISLQTLCPQSEEHASLVYEGLGLLDLIGCSGDSHFWGSGPPRAFRGDRLLRGWEVQICCPALWLQQVLGAWVSSRGPLWAARGGPDWHAQPSLCRAPWGTKPSPAWEGLRWEPPGPSPGPWALSLCHPGPLPLAL